jgi:hypothetical protein
MRPKTAGPLTANDVRAIRRAVKNGIPRREVARDFEILKATVDRIITGETYLWVKDLEEERALEEARKKQNTPTAEDEDHMEAMAQRLLKLQEGGL